MCEHFNLALEMIHRKGDGAELGIESLNYWWQMCMYLLIQRFDSNTSQLIIRSNIFIKATLLYFMPLSECMQNKHFPRCQLAPFRRNERRTTFPVFQLPGLVGKCVSDSEPPSSSSRKAKTRLHKL